jgi:hypothetical protein
MGGLIYRNLYDEDGAIVSNDGKVLYKVPDIAHYRIKEGVEEIDKHAFKNRPHLKEVDIPYTVQWYMDEPMSNDAMMYAPKGLKVNYWNWPYPENCIRSDELEAEIAEGWIDEFGAVYSKDRKRLLVCADVRNYKIKEGTEQVDRLAFVGCNKLQCLYLPYTLPEESFDAILGGTDTVGAICFWDRPYVPEELDPNEAWADDEVFIDDNDVVYTKDRKRLLYARIGLKGSYYVVPNGTMTICDQAFLFHEGYLVLSVPASIKVIGDDIFGKDGGKIIIRDEL